MRSQRRNAANCLRSTRLRTLAALTLRFGQAPGSAVLATTVLFIIDLPPALGAETHRIEPVLVVAADGVVVAVTVGGHLRIGASIAVGAVRLYMGCGARGARERSGG